jgi:hypothetical protein
MSDPIYWVEYFISKGWSIGQIRSLLIVPKATAVLSMAGSAYVIQDVLRDPTKRKESTFHRLMLGVCISDIISSFCLWFLGSWVMPKGIQLYAIGNNTTCQISAAIGLSAVLCAYYYTASLATYYLVLLRFNWEKSSLRAAEMYLHLIPIFIALIDMVVNFSAGGYRAAGLLGCAG